MPETPPGGGPGGSAPSFFHILYIAELKRKGWVQKKQTQKESNLNKLPEIKDGFIQSYSYEGNGAVILQPYYAVCARNSLVVLFSPPP